MASRRLNDLDPKFRLIVVEFLARAVEAKLDPRIIETRRTLEEHAENVKRGRSWTKHSRHIDGLAIDVCPASLLQKPDWDPGSILWAQLAAIGEAVGMRCGYHWAQKDNCHFELGG